MTSGDRSHVLAARCGRDANDLAVRMAVATAVWGAVAALDHWADADFTPGLREIYTATMDSVIGAIERILTSGPGA